ncbi:hypothetical protein D1781_09925 [Amnibacterium setariae]|uniref:Uncharacterized protein n=1 Tax=Amnibacterium setariae TaxID=2306585 RepID=A0A3A1TUE5_9MICO|nr:hypothetical protein D1781_09925 [Amnibacterium setariae]
MRESLAMWTDQVILSKGSFRIERRARMSLDRRLKMLANSAVHAWVEGQALADDEVVVRGARHEVGWHGRGAPRRLGEPDVR